MPTITRQRVSAKLSFLSDDDAMKLLAKIKRVGRGAYIQAVAALIGDSDPDINLMATQYLSGRAYRIEQQKLYEAQRRQT